MKPSGHARTSAASPSPLAALKADIATCIKCAACMPACPTYRDGRRETLGPRGRLALSAALLAGEITAEDGVTFPVTSCIDCRACVPACPRHIPLAEIFYAAKAELAAQGAGGWRARLLADITRRVVVNNRFTRFLPAARFLMGIYRGIADQSPAARLLPFFRDGRKRLLPEVVRRPMTDDYPERLAVPNPRGRVAFFPGCVINFTSTGIGHATLSVLSKLDIEVVLPREAPCCGIPLLSLGDRQGARQVARDVIRRYGKLDVDRVVTACASCGTTLRDTYPDLLDHDPEAVEFARKVMDISEYITQHTDYRARAARLDEAVTYHDPCHLVRGMGVTEAPREILRVISGLTEMAGADRCCGFGGLFSALHYDMALEVGRHKAEAVAATGAGTVATGCPGCQMHMNDTLARGAVNARVLHTVELLDRSLVQERNVSDKQSAT